MQTLVIEGRFNGPPGSANGGYAAGLLAREIDGPAEVTLLAPPPLDRPLTVAWKDSRVRLLDGDLPVAEAVAATIEDVAPPVAVTVGEAARASEGYVGFADHEFPTCFVCGPQRPDKDGLGIYAGRVPGTDVVAAPWTPAAEFAAAEGHVAAPFVWAALDCPAYFGGGGAERALLGRMATDLREPVRAGEPCVVLGWGTGGGGRKHLAASAVLDAEGRLVAVARSVWITPRRA